jgi:hypothetical protein
MAPGSDEDDGIVREVSVLERHGASHRVDDKLDELIVAAECSEESRADREEIERPAITLTSTLSVVVLAKAGMPTDVGRGWRQGSTHFAQY